MSQKDNLLNIPEAARMLGVAEVTVRRHIESGHIAASKYFGKWKIRESEVNRIIRESGIDTSQDRGDE